jgi:hypothetical protein
MLPVQLLRQKRERRIKLARKSLRILSQIMLLEIHPRTKMALRIQKMKAKSDVVMTALQLYAEDTELPITGSQIKKPPRIIIQSLTKELFGGHKKDPYSYILRKTAGD